MKPEPQIALQSLGIAKDTKLYELIDRGIDIEIKDKLGERAYEVLQILMCEIHEVSEALESLIKKSIKTC